MQEGFLNEFNMYKNTRRMICQEYDHGIILPRIFDNSGPVWGKGGVCDCENSFSELSEYHGGWAEHGGYYEWENEEYLDSEVIYFGVFFNHWGHFLVDLIGRMWYCSKYPEKIKNKKIAYLGEEDPRGNFLEFFELLGLKKSQLIHITKPTRCRKVIVPEFSCRPCIWYTSEFESVFDTVVQNSYKMIQDTSGIKNNKVYFTRLNLAKAKTSEFGEKLIARWMDKNGFEILTPESLTLSQQIQVWNGAQEIACLNGSIPINVIFSKNTGLKLVVLNKTSLIHKNLDLFLLIRPVSITFLNVYFEPFKKYPRSIGEGPFLLGISEDIYRYSERNNLSVPFSKMEVWIDFILNYLRLIWKIIDFKDKIRTPLSAVYHMLKK